MKIAIAQINPVIGDFKYNYEKIKKNSEKAKNMSCDLIVFPELAISGYPPRDLLEKKNFINANVDCLNKLVKSIHGIGVICGFVEPNNSDDGMPLFNSAAFFEDGVLLHKAHKRLLPAYDIFDETRYYEHGKECIPYKYKGHLIGLTICEDVWNDKDIFKKRRYHIDPVASMIKKDADIIVNIAASPFGKGKHEFRLNMLASAAKKYNVPVLFANQVGGNDSVLFDGISMAIDKHGEIASRAHDFEEDMIWFDSSEKRNLKTYTNSIHSVSESDAESVLKALVTGTRDYVLKCGFSKAVVGLSGGIDSALTVCIAVMALGRENVLSVFMPSKYTSYDNFEDTKNLADNLGIELITIPIDSIFDQFISSFYSPDQNGSADSQAEAFNTDPGTTEQNIQARIRGTLLMAISNKHGHLLLSTGNKSELAVGYCTLYGDMSGGLAVISDVPKTMVYELCAIINKTNKIDKDKNIIPKRIIEKAPSAELKPNQTDQDDLPPYEILDPILKGYIEDLKSADELVKMGFEKNLVQDIISRVDQNEYKRKQAPPGLKVTSKAFGYGRRYPIAQKYTF